MVWLPKCMVTHKPPCVMPQQVLSSVQTTFQAARVDETADPTTLPARHKRRKTSLACTNCRYRKTRCDGRRPVCVACEKRRVMSTCIYERPPLNFQRNGVHGDLISPPRPGEDDQQGNARFNYVTTTNHNQRLTSTSTGPPQNDQRRPSGASFSEEDEEQHRVDGVATVASFGDDTALYGRSSTIAFVQHVTDGLEGHGEPCRPTVSTGAQHSRIAQGERSHSSTRPEIIRDKDDTAAVYPRRRSADDYFLCYWEFIHPVFPIIHKSSFIDKYEEFWLPGNGHKPPDDDFDVENALFSSMLNLIFALGCQFSTLVPATKKPSMADKFYQRSRKLFIFEILDSLSLPLVQLLLVQGVYLQSSRYATRCWNVVGLAVRVAQGLGLHLNIERKSETQLAREMNRRVWHTCVVLDRLLAMTFGRPVMISNPVNVPIPLLIDDEYLRNDGEKGVQPVDTPSRLGLFVSSCRLFEILAEILNQFCGEQSEARSTDDHDCEAQDTDMIADVLALNRRLDKFAVSVPECLQVSKVSQIGIPNSDSCVHLQQQVLYCRFLYVRLLSLRPLLLYAKRRGRPFSHELSEDGSQPSLDGKLVDVCCISCISTAHRLIEIIHQHLDTAYKSSGWHSVYFTFAAATTLIAAQQCPYLDTENENSSFETSWNRCLTTLEHYREQIHSAPQAIHVLQVLRSGGFSAQFHTHGRDSSLVASNNISEGHFDDNDSSGTTAMHLDTAGQIDISHFNPYGTDIISDAWFGSIL